jgi:glutamine amidotransferase
MIAILDYGIGNLLSVKNMLGKAGAKDITITSTAQELAAADKIVLPGVGHFDNGMKRLRASGMYETLNQKVLDEKTPVIGICLGAQMLTKGSEEGDEPGLGWIDAECKRFDAAKMDEKLPVPHMGWAEVTQKRNAEILAELPEEPRYYFTHSYHIVCNDAADELLTARYGYDFTAAVQHANIVGTQFHPEKSHKFGMRLLANFARS